MKAEYFLRSGTWWLGLVVVVAAIVMASKSALHPVAGDFHAAAAKEERGTTGTVKSESRSALLTKVREGAVRSLSVREMALQLMDAAAPFSKRRHAARLLARDGSPEAILAVKRALEGASEPLQATLAEGLGSGSSAACRVLLASLLNSSSEVVALGAVRGLGESGTRDAAATLAGLLADAGRSAEFRSEVALALAQSQRPEALDALVGALHASDANVLTESILRGIGRFPFDQTRTFLYNYLTSAQTATEDRVAALDALQDAPGDVGPLLLAYARHENPSVRAAAAAALVSTEDRGNLARPIVKLLQESSDSAVRQSLYRALSFQDDWVLNDVFSSLEKETDIAARVAGLSLFAEAAHGDHGEIAAYFNRNILPELTHLAMTSVDFDAQMGAVIALRAAGTAEALQALQQIAAETKNPKLAERLRGD